jgi:hypothetical protein
MSPRNPDIYQIACQAYSAYSFATNAGLGPDGGDKKNVMMRHV